MYFQIAMDFEIFTALMPILTIPPPDPSSFFDHLFTLLLLLVRPPPDPLLDIRHRLFGKKTVWKGRDVFALFSTHRYEFYRATGETPETMIAMINIIGHRIHGNRNRGRPYKLSPRNRIMLAMLWLKTYPCYFMLSLLFDVSSYTVSSTISRIIPLLWEAYSPEIEWPTLNEWLSIRNTWPQLPNALGAIDGTSHPIYRPQNEPQEQFYSRHRHMHCIHTQVLVDNQNHIRLIRSGFLGHQNDAQQFNSLPQIGHGLPLNFPPDCYLLGDKIYANRYPVVTPFKRHQLRNKTRRERRKCQKVNRRIGECRIYVEYAICKLKGYRVLGTMWRHPRCKINQTVELCAGLVERRYHLFDV